MNAKTRTAILSTAAFLTTVTMAGAQTSRPAVLKAWTFDKSGDLQGWTAGGDVRNLKAQADGLRFETAGTDPILTGPAFDAIPATNNQVVVVEMACDVPITGELYYTNKTEGRYGGFEPEWMTRAFLPGTGKASEVQSVVIWPFWEELGKVIRLRFDPPTGAKCRLVSIRIVDDSGQASPTYVWDFARGELYTWRPMYGLATPKAQAGESLALSAPTSQGLLLTAVRPFDAASRPVLRLRAEGEADVAFYWVTREGKGVLGTSVPLPDAARVSSQGAETLVDLRTEAAWKGTVTHIGIGPSERSVRVWKLSLERAAAEWPPAPRHFGRDRAPRADKVAYVPAPKPVGTDYDIGVYYFPGWASDRPDGTSSRWEKQAGFPERDPVLGWYREGDPDVADWHIKWAVENGIRFFIYDWYWRDGKVTLEEGLHDGLLKARYRDMLKFCIMWANHPPFSNHSKEQFVQVADYWVEHYLKLPNYYCIDGKPYVSFFHIGELQKCFGTDEKLADAFSAMRRRVREKGLPGLYIVACGDAGKTSQEWAKKVGFDAVTAYNYPAAGAATTQSPYEPYIRAHEDIWRSAREAGVIRYIPLLTSNWDARPWHGAGTNARFGRTTQRLEAGLKRMRAFMDETGEKVGILEAWNEWGEGSYIEPNREFGFGDLEAIRRTFAKPGDWPENIGPKDVGLGPYDVRTVKTPGNGPAIVPVGHRLDVYPGRLTIDGKTAETLAATLDVPPIETRRIVIDDYAIVAGPVNSWLGGNRLWIDAVRDRRNLLPGSFVPGSLRVESRDATHALYTEGKDYTVDTKWGAFGLTPASRLKPGAHVRVAYEMSLRRVDAVVVDETGKPRCLRGEATADCPVPPAIPPKSAHLASIYLPFNAGAIQPYEVYPILAPEARPRAACTGAKPERTLDKLRTGKPVTIVCWGDSVTACGEASTPDKCYVKLLESRLRKRYPDAQVHVVNAGIGGTSTPGRLPAFQKEVLAVKPDLVTLEYVNDMGLPDDTLQRNYTEILERLRAAGAELILITPHFTMPEWMELPHGRGPEKRRGVMFLRRFAEEHKVPLADASRRWEELQDLGVPYETLLRNGINHPDDRGHAFFADELMRVLE